MEWIYLLLLLPILGSIIGFMFGRVELTGKKGLKRILYTIFLTFLLWGFIFLFDDILFQLIGVLFVLYDFYTLWFKNGKRKVD